MSPFHHTYVFAAADQYRTHRPDEAVPLEVPSLVVSMLTTPRALSMRGPTGRDGADAPLLFDARGVGLPASRDGVGGTGRVDRVAWAAWRVGASLGPRAGAEARLGLEFTLPWPGRDGGGDLEGDDRVEDGARRVGPEA